MFQLDSLGDWGKGENMLYLLVKKGHVLQWKMLKIFFKLFFLFFAFQPELIANYAINFQVGSADPKLSVSSGVGEKKSLKSFTQNNFYRGTLGNQKAEVPCFLSGQSIRVQSNNIKMKTFHQDETDVLHD